VHLRRVKRLGDAALRVDRDSCNGFLTLLASPRVGTLSTRFVSGSRQGSADQLPQISGFTVTARCTFPEFGVCLDVIFITSVAFHAGLAFCQDKSGRTAILLS
jgi:hypothetical protein